MKRRYVTLDVFTDRRFAGNPLAVVLEAGGLGTEQMQAVANEFNLPETVFVMPADEAKHRARCRIFTPKRELPFAGHPTVGTAVLLATLDGAKGDKGDKGGEFVLEEKIGLIRCRVNPRAGGGEASFTLPVLPSPVAAPPPNETIAAALGLDVADIGAGDLAPSCWSAGNPFLFVPLGSIDAVRRASPDLAAFRALAPTFPGLFVFSRQTAEKGNDFHARMFAPAMGIIEDPATGSAVAAFAGLLGRFGGYGDGDHKVAIEQGYEMGRPSLIRLGMTMVAGQFTSVTVGGSAVIVAEGAIEA
ncbi:MAG: PhzF family phenazine biosynthesis protein [Pseudolabrys sp.]